ncbi:MAG: autotransporter domain-containing protein [Endomicrobia bacterium]|nr:autotransporter domain-containing protein [Endomicrobiia bacterium]MCL2506573.1 autotransporter domain-containing protein [Endomicrobiia bacterium]MCL2506590.1 autotransporter domain-containing protein [Endomicrobiia bacterium]
MKKVLLTVSFVMSVLAVNVFADYDAFQSSITTGINAILTGDITKESWNISNPVIPSSLTITGNGNTIDLSNNGNLLSIYEPGITLTFNGGITIKNGNNINPYGGGVIASTAANAHIIFNGPAVFESNKSASVSNSYGGVIYSSAAKIYFNDDVLFKNNAVYNNGLGAGIYAMNSIISFAGNNIVFSSNTGGAIYADSGLMTFAAGNNIVFDSNLAVNGGAIWIYRFNEMTFTSPDITFNNNISSGSSGYGGAIFVFSTMTFNGNSAVFSDNKAGGYGGAISSMYTNNESIPNINFNSNQTLFFNNISSGIGGAIYSSQYSIWSFSGETIFGGNIALSSGGAIYSAQNSTWNFSGSNILFSNNISSGTSGFGGAIFSSGSYFSFASSSFDDIAFFNNAAYASGGSIYSYFSAYSFVSYGFGNINFTSNTAANAGGAIYDSSSTYSFASYGFGSINFKNNTASYGGGAINSFFSNFYFMSFRDIDFVNNTAGSGGAIYDGNGSYFSFLSHGNINFSNNNTFSGNGGAIYGNNKSSFSFVSYSDINFLKNTAYGEGGAIYGFSNSSFSFVSYGDTNFLNNISSGSIVYGGAICSYSSSYSFVSSGDINFNNNTVSGSDYGHGGAIYDYYNSYFSFVSQGNINFLNNTASSYGYGGAIYANYSTITFSAKLVKFENNSAWVGGAIHNNGSIVDFNTTNSDLTILFKNNYAGNDLNDIFLSNNGYLNFNAINGNIILPNGMRVDVDSGGIINKTGPGSLTFGGNTIINSTVFNITDGDIIFLDNATFTGPSIVLPAGNILNMQNETVNTITVEEFSITSNTKIDIWANGNNDKIYAGSATIGGNLDIKSRAGRYDNVVYDIVISTQLTGMFSSTSSYYGSLQNEQLTFTVQANPENANIAQLVVNGKWLSTFRNINGLSFNQKEAANALDRLSDTPTLSDEMADIITDLILESEANQKAALSQVSGYFNSNVIRNAAADSPNNEIYDKIKNHAIEDVTNSGIWTQVKGGVEIFKENENSASNYKDNSWGLMAGFDRYIGDKEILWGVFARFIGNNISQGDNSAKGNKKGLGVYGGYTIDEKWELKGLLLGSFDSFSTERRIALLNSTAKGDVDAFTISADIEGALRVEIKENTNVKPYFGLELQNVNYKGFKESGAEAVNLNVKGGKYIRSAARLGAGIEYDKKDWNIYGKLEGKYLMTGKEPEIESVFEGTNVSFKSRGTEEGKIQLGLGLGGEIFIAQDWKLFANGNFYTASRYQNIYGNIGIRYMLGK